MRLGSRRKGRWLVVIGLTLALVVAAAYGVLRVQFDGPDLGTNIASILNKRMRGRIEIGTVEWPAASLSKVASGGWVPVVLRDVNVWDDCALSSVSERDPEEIRITDPNEDCTPDDQPDTAPGSTRRPRKLLLRTPLLTAEIDVHAILFGNHDMVFRHLNVHGGEALIEQTREPYPLHAYDRTIVSIISAFYPRMKAGFRAGIYADSSPPIFDLRDIHVEGLNLTVHAGPYSMSKPGAVGYSMTARIEDVTIDTGAPTRDDSYLYMNATDPLIAKFYVRLAATGKRGHLRFRDDGPRSAFRLPAAGEAWPPKGRDASYVIELVDVNLARLAQLPTEWTHHDTVANTLELDLSARGIPCDDDGAGPAPGVPLAKDIADVHLTGQLQSYWDRPYDGAWDLALTGKNLGPVLHTCIKRKVSGDNLYGTVTLTGPFVANPKVGLELHNLDVAIPIAPGEEPLRLTLAEVHGSIDLVNDTGKIDKTKALVRGGKEPGEIDLAATFALAPYSVNASVDIAKPIDAYRFLPAKLRDTGGHFISGHLHATGDVDYGFALDELDLSLGMVPGDRSLRMHNGRLFTKNDFDKIDIDKVNIEAGQSHALVDGWVDTVKSTLHISIDGDFPDLDVWLRRFDLPQFATKAGGGHVEINGPLTNPTFDVGTELSGIPCLDKLRLSARVADGVADVSSFSTGAFGGSLKGSARVRLGDIPVIEKLHLAGSQLTAAKLCGLKGKVRGTLGTVEADLHGTLDKNRSALDWLGLASVYVRADHLDVSGDAYSDIALCINRKDDQRCRPRPARAGIDDTADCEAAKRGSGFCAVASAVRDNGGTFDATIAKLDATHVGKKVTPARLGGTVSIDDLPVAVLAPLIGPGTAGGVFSTTLRLAGAPTAPQATGYVDVLRAWVKDAFVGDSQLVVEPATLASGAAAVTIHGAALAGRLELRATIGTQAPYPVELALDVHRVELTPFLDLQTKLRFSDPIEGWASGRITVRTELAPLSGKPPEPDAWIELSELRLTVAHRTQDGRLTPLALTLVGKDPKQAAAASIHLTKTSIELACRDASAPGGSTPCSTWLSTPAGDLNFSGSATGSGVKLTADGTLDLGKLQSLLDTTFDDLSGGGQLHLAVGGSLDAPTIEAAFDIADIKLRTVGSDTIVQAPSGLIRYANSNLGFNGVIIKTQDEHEVAGQLTVHGAIALSGITPVSWGVLIDGQVAGKLLTVLAPSVASQATGVATIAEDGPILLSGKGALPLVSGRLTFGGAHPIGVTPRGVAHELALTNGTLEVTTTTEGDHRTYDVDIASVYGTVDGAGKLDDITGELILRDGTLAHASVQLSASGVPFKIPGTLELLLSARAVTLDLADERAAWVVGGAVTIQSGSFTRGYELTEAIQPQAPTAGRVRPFWETYPALGNATLNNIDLNIEKFDVKNNIAKIALAGRATISGSPRDPRLSGQISTQQGTFRIPGTRADFTRTTGSVTFSEDRAASNPKLDVTSDSDYIDLTGQSHVITLTISGTLESPVWDLKTSTGYDKSQTLALLVLGRNPEQLRRSLGDQTIGTDPTRVDPTTNPSSGFADQIVKDLAGDYVSSLLGSSLTKITGLDILRFELGFGSIGIHAEKKAYENITLIGEYELTIRGNTINAKAVARLPWKFFRPSDRFELQGSYLRKDFIDPAEQDILDRGGKFVYKLFIP